MKRLTVNKSAREMTGIELAHNCMYSHDGWARYRDFDKDMDLFDFIREFAKAENEGLPADSEVVAEMLLDGLQYGIDNPFGRVALVYHLMWAMADLRETLKAYEDTGLAPEEILTGAQLAEIACMQIRFKKMQELLERAAEEIENCYGAETELTKAMRKQLD